MERSEEEEEEEEMEKQSNSTTVEHQKNKQLGQKRSSKECKNKKKEIKVVYISNPMKFQTSAANFRELVQKVTGQDSDISNFPENTTTTAFASQLSDTTTTTSSSVEDDGFAESWSAFVPPSMFYEPPQGFFRPPADRV